MTPHSRLALCAALLLTLAAAPAPAAPDLPAVGKPAPTFSLRDREGALVALGDLCYPGAARSHQPKHVVVLDFFRTDCKPCIKGLPRLVELYKRLAGKPVKVMLVALLEEDEGQEKLDAFLKNRQLPIPVLVDAYAVASKKYVSKGGGVQIPALFVIDRDGVLRARHGGVEAKEQAALLQQITDLLK